MERGEVISPPGAPAGASPLAFDTEAFASLRTLLRRAGYGDGEVAARADIESIYDFRSIREGREDAGEPRDALDTLIRLFMDGEPVERAAVDACLPGLARAAARLGLVRDHAFDAERMVATVRLYPMHGLFIVSDLEHDPDAARDAPYEPPPDAVYSAITQSTSMFLGLLPAHPCSRFLDLCAGSGIAALLAAPHADEVIAVDIAGRSVTFARFNTALNGLVNVRVEQSDVYDGLEGETFDRIVAHPPYMPAHDRALIYRDGGEDGEQVTRRVLEGLPAHLRPGGRFDCIAILTDREYAPVESRVRELLGEHAEEFDILVLVTQANAPVDAYARLVREGRAGFAEAERHVRRFGELKAERIVGCSLVIARHDSPRPAVTVRRTRSPQTDAAAIEWVLGWMRASTDPGLPARLFDARPRHSPHVRMDRDYAPGADGWQAGECRIRVDAPFGMVVPVSLETAAFLARCDGTVTVRELFARLQRAGVLGNETEPREFAGLVRSLVLGGFLLLDPPSED